ncbi:MAG: primosomal protein N' [Firmicutes bacterium]|nr:primosomal protein N' [Bacillota bacterium]
MDKLYADVIVDISQGKLDRTFQYEIPDELYHEIKIGSRVRIPFGKGQREITGYVTGISANPKVEESRIKKILGQSVQGVAVESKLIALAEWISTNYGSTMNQALKTVLPVKEKKKQKENRFLTLNFSRSEAEEFLEVCERKHYKAKARLVQALLMQPMLTYSEAIHTWKISGTVIKGLEDQKVITVERERIYRSPVLAEQQGGQKKILNAEQERVFLAVCKEWETSVPRPVLLHGVTGSGKTEVYMELIQKVLEEGKQVIVLIPEIALTYQTVKRFSKRFGSCVSFLHSRLSAGEKYDQFEQAKKGEISIVVGPRSALFTPFPDLGLIIIDEEHEPSYKSEKTPCYHAREVAIERGRMENAKIVMGSATPSVESYEKGKSGEYFLQTLSCRYENRALPKVYTIDMKQELKEGNRSIFSVLLKEKMEERLHRKEQVILFLNRRGYTGFISCRSCGHVMKCPHCDVSLTSHKNGQLICHYCGYSIPDVKNCPVCGSPYIGGFRAGTQQIEEQVQKFFPQAKILRMDADTTRKKEDHEKILSAFAKGEADILVGTQMIVKGHDFPKVTLVGVLAADLSLNGTDYMAGERTFQLLAQAVGRAGRGCLPGEAVIQTYQPDHYSVQAAAAQDYEAFYEKEIGYRILMGYPPAKAMAMIRASCENQELLEQGIGYCRKYIEKIYKRQDLILVGPAPESVAKVQDLYRMVLYMRHSDRKILVKITELLEQYIQINKGFDKIHIQFDFI